ncbi:MAG TPA: sulfate ABC transporter substrate-binding protein [Anaerolineae bacterium]|nr:sulfate ABC transporter substrate-binding protein [Anaerolineae bacterium]
MMKKLSTLLTTLVLIGLLAGCGGTAATTPDTAGRGNQPIQLTLGAYTTPREAYSQIIPLFQAEWKQRTGQDVTFEESYQGSGAQSRAIVEGFEADIAALSLEADIDRIRAAGLITHAWKSKAHAGMISDSIVVFAVRPGNPEGIQDWADLAKPGLEVLTPNPQTSGGAQWNILAVYGAAFRGRVAGVPQGDEAAAMDFLKAVLKNVTVMDKSARESVTNFEAGVGDVLITYENEVLVGQQAGADYEMIMPRSTILIENPVAVVDSYVDKHGTRAAAEAFVEFLFTRPAQEIFAQYGLRSVDPEVAQATAEQYPPVEDLFTVKDFGGWQDVADKFFDDDGIYSVAIAEVQGP